MKTKVYEVVGRQAGGNQDMKIEFICATSKAQAREVSAFNYIKTVHLRRDIDPATIQKTYNIVFNDSENSNDKGFVLPFEDAEAYIERYNGTKESYFADYKGGTVSIVCNETGETIYETEVK